MEDQNTQKETMGSGAKSHKHWSCSGHGWWFVKFIIGILILMLVFSAGVALGRHKGQMYGKGYGENGLKITRHRVGLYGNNPMMGGGFGGRGMMQGWGTNEGTQSLSSVFGPITKIDGNKITITDNGGKDQQIVSQSSTVIMAATGLTDLKSLQTGQKISAYGTLDKDNVLTAQTIRIE